MHDNRSYYFYPEFHLKVRVKSTFNVTNPDIFRVIKRKKQLYILGIKVAKFDHYLHNSWK